KHSANGGEIAMSEAKEAILAKIQNALRNVPPEERPEDIDVSWHYRRKGNREPADVAALFAERVGEYKATIKRIRASELTAVIAESCRQQKVQQLVVPGGFPREWLPDNVTFLFDKMDTPLSNGELDRSDGVITTCALGVAETGTIILDAGPGQGRRALTLLPDYHLCLIREGQIVELV